MATKSTKSKKVEEKPKLRNLLTDEQMAKLSQKTEETKAQEPKKDEKAEQKKKKTTARTTKSVVKSSGMTVKEAMEAVKDLQDEEGSLPDALTELEMSAFKVLEVDEKVYFLRRWRAYMKDFDIQTAADEALLRDIILEEVHVNRLRTTSFQNPKVDLSEQLKKSVERREKALSKLQSVRKQKWKRIDEAENLAQLILQFDKRKLLYEEKLDEKDEEENELRGKNNKQFEADVLEAREGYTGAVQDYDFKRPKPAVPAKEPKTEEEALWQTIALERED